MKLKIITSSVLILIVTLISINITSAQENDIFISPSILEISTTLNSIKEATLTISSKEDTIITLEESKQFQDFLIIENKTINLIANNPTQIRIKIQPSINTIPNIYPGFITIKNKEIEKTIPLIINIKPQKSNFDLKLDLPIKKVNTGDKLTGNLEIVNLGDFKPLKLDITQKIKNINNNILETSKEIKVIDKQLVLPLQLTVPPTKSGIYFLEIEIQSDLSTERISKSFIILETQNLEQPSNITRNSLLLFVLSVLLTIILLFIKKFYNISIKKIYIILFIIIILIIVLFISNILKVEEISQLPTISKESANSQNLSEIVSIDTLTNEPFLRNVTEHFLIYIVESYEIKKPEIKVGSTENFIFITLGDTRLEIAKSGRKFDLNIVSKSLGPVKCNLLCISKLILLSKIISIIVIVLLVFTHSHKKFFKKSKKPEEESEVDRINRLLLSTEAKLKKVKLFPTIRNFFIDLLNLDYEATIEEIISEITKTKFNKKIKNNTNKILNNLNIYEYSQESITKKELKKEFNILLLQIKDYMKTHINIKNIEVNNDNIQKRGS